MKRIPKTLMHIGSICIFIGAIIVGAPNCVHAESPQDTSCRTLDRQLALATSAEKDELSEFGFTYLSADTPRDIPSIVISKDVIDDCNHRLLAEEYFVNRVYGRDYFKVNSSMLSESSTYVAYAAYMAITNGLLVWKDGTEHEIYNIISDAISTAWTPWLIKLVKANGLELRYFSPANFLSPPAEIAAISQRSISNLKFDRLPDYELIKHLMILKNSNAKMNFERYLDGKLSTPGYTSLERATLFAMARELLSKPRITLRDAYDFQLEIIGQ